MKQVTIERARRLLAQGEQVMALIDRYGVGVFAGEERECLRVTEIIPQPERYERDFEGATYSEETPYGAINDSGWDLVFSDGATFEVLTEIGWNTTGGVILAGAPE